MADSKIDMDAARTATMEPPKTTPIAPIVLKAENQKDKLQEITDKLEQGIKDLFASDKYNDYLNVMSKFHHYSFRNTLLILMQKPDAEHIAGYGAWQKNFNRQVRKGEKGIRIIAPSPYKMQKEVEKINPKTQKPYMKNGKPVMEQVEITVPAYKVTTVFDVSQTEGEPLPSLGVDELAGKVKDYKEFSTALDSISPFPIFYEDIESGAKGYCNHTEGRIAIQKGMSEVQTVKTKIHEITHGKLHSITPEEAKKLPEEERKDRHTREVEAESVADTVCQHYGIDTSDYTFAYVAGWSSSVELPELQKSLNTIQKTANEIISGIDGYFRELNKEQNKANEEQTKPEQQEQAETKDDFSDLPESDAETAEKLFNDVVSETASKSETVSKSETAAKSETPAMDALEAKAMKGEPISLMSMVDAIKADKAKAAEPKKDAAKKEKSKKPSVRKKLDAAKKQAAKQTEKKEPKKEKETAR